MDVEPQHVEVARESILHEPARLRGRQAELRPVMPGADRLVCVRIDAERDAHENAPHARGRGELRLVGRVQHDGGAFGRRLGEESLVLVVAVDDDLVA